jgi:hypothetical protein
MIIRKQASLILIIKAAQINQFVFFTMPTLAALSTRSPIFQPVSITSAIVLFSYVCSGIV